VRISRQLLLVLLLVGVLPLAIGAAIVYFIVSRQAEELMGARLEASVRHAGETIDEFMLTTERDVRAVAHAVAGTTVQIGKRSTLLTRLVMTYPYMTKLTLVDHVGRVLASSDAGSLGRSLYERYPELDVNVAKAFAVTPDDVVVSDLSEDFYEEGQAPKPRFERLPDLELLTPVIGADGEIAAVLVAMAETKHFVKLLDDIKHRTGGLVSAALVDRRHRVLVTTDFEADDNSYHEGIELLKSGAPAANRKFMVHEDLGLIGFATLAEYGVNGAGGWSLIGRARYDEVMAPVHRLMVKSTVVIGVLLLVAIAAALWFARSLSRPIVSLTRRAEAMAIGELSGHVDVVGGHEMSLLATAFDRMADSITSKTAALEAEVEQRKARAAQLEQARTAAEGASRAKTEFLANMSHEIRTPMNGVLGFTNLLLDSELGAEQRIHVQTVRQSAEALLQIINDILDFSKVEAGKLSVERLPFAVREALDDVLGLLTPQAEQQGLELALKVHDAVPHYLENDPGRVRQVLLNLIGNALKFTRRGHVLVEVGVAHETAEPTVCFSITDTGVGIPADKQARLFKEFSQGDASTTREFGGTGLGLAICKRLVALMGGAIGFSSASAQGSTFWFTLPAAASEQPRAAPQSLAQLQGLRVLIVDDLEINRRLLAEQLSDWGIAHESAASGAQALELMHAACTRNQPFAVALLDFLMPMMDGLELGGRIKADPALRDTRLIMLTSGSQRSSAASFLAAGFSAFLMKPLLRSQQLLAAISSALTSAGPNSYTGPGVPAVSPAVGEVKQQAAKSSAALPGEGMRVLVAEDNTVNQLLVKRMLEKLGCRVDIAADGSEAVSLVAELHYDLVLMDGSMPVMDGLIATARIRALEGAGPRVPIVALTAHALPEDRARFLAAGMDGYIAKPVRPEELRRVIEQWQRTPVVADIRPDITMDGAA
jgi:signal transduction histidine kinase/DNA-binding response OmpR family regulator